MFNYLFNRDKKTEISENVLHRLQKEGFKLSDAESRYFHQWVPDLCAADWGASRDSKSPYRILDKKMKHALQKAKKNIVRDKDSFRDGKNFSFRHLSYWETDYLSQAITIRLRDVALESAPTPLPRFRKDQACDNRIPHGHMQMANWLYFKVKCPPSNNPNDHARHNQQLQAKVMPILKKSIKKGLIEDTLREAIRHIKSAPKAQISAVPRLQKQRSMPISIKPFDNATMPGSAATAQYLYPRIKKQLSAPNIQYDRRYLQQPRLVPIGPHFIRNPSQPLLQRAVPIIPYMVDNSRMYRHAPTAGQIADPQIKYLAYPVAQNDQRYRKRVP